MTARIFFCGALLAASFTVYADPVERMVWGDVVAVEPITADVKIALRPDCSGGKPAGTTLAELLRWDLRPECARRREQQVSGYRVRYQWDGRIYTREMAQRPGSRVPLLIKFSVDPQKRQQSR